MRDFGLVMFGAGATVTFGLSTILLRQLGPTNAVMMATIGDAVMLAGACLAVAAMGIGYLASH